MDTQYMYQVLRPLKSHGKFPPSTPKLVLTFYDAAHISAGNHQLELVINYPRANEEWLMD